MNFFIYKCDGRCSFFVILVSIIVLPFLWDVVMPEKDRILIDKKGNVETLAKQVYVLVDEEGFFKNQQKIINQKIVALKTDPITRIDIDVKRMELKIDYGIAKGFTADYREATAEEAVGKLSDDEIAKIIQIERTLAVNDLQEIMKYLHSKYP
jgi:hypothetical protein